MRHLIFDTETTDLIHNSSRPLSKQPKIAEIFGMILDDEKDWQEVETFYAFLNPEKPMNPKAAQATGFTPEMFVGKPKFLSIAGPLQDFFSRADIYVAHNLGFDKQVIAFEFQRMEKKFNFPPRGICTIEATEHFHGYRMNLTALHTELFGEGFEKAHSAENDVRATARCYVELVKRGII